MAYYFAEGSKFQFSSTFAAPSTVSGATNANPSVLTTSAAHGLVDNDEFLFISGWEDATNTIYRADMLTATTVSPLGLDTTSTSTFGAGSGTGTIKKVSTWTDIPQVVGINTNGGGARFSTVQLLSSRYGLKIPTGFEALSTTLTLAHDAANANYIAMLALSRTLTPVGFRILVAGGGTSYAYGYLSVGEFPKFAAGNANTVDAELTFIGRPISY